MSPNEQLLRAYETYIPSVSPLVEALFKIILAVMLVLSFGAGYVAYQVKERPPQHAATMEKFKTRFIIQRKKEETPPPPKKKKVETKPVDLTKKSTLRANREDPQPDTKKKKVRRVYGLKRVYSKGLGSGGSLSDAVIGKLGNTLNKEVDTLTATREDIKGEVVSSTTVTQAPRFKKRARPEYTSEMIEHQVEGVVRVKVLVDIDGRVKKVRVLNDLGHGSAQQAVAVCWKLEFEPAMRDNNPVAVWIIIPIRFVLLG